MADSGVGWGECGGVDEGNCFVLIPFPMICFIFVQNGFYFLRGWEHVTEHSY